MTNKELIERYVYASTKRIVNKKERKDIALELNSLIDDMLLERCGEREPEEKDLRVIFAEIGTPSEVYRKYSPDSDKALLSGEYYVLCKYLLKIVLPCVFFGLIITNFVLLFTGENTTAFEFILKLLSMELQSLISVFAGFVIVFALLERKKVSISSIESDFDLNTLPPVPKKSETISRAESIFGIVMSVLFMIVFLFVPQIIGYIKIGEGFVPLFNLQHLKELSFFIITFGVVGIIDCVVRLIESRYTLKVLLSSLITNGITLILGFVVFAPATAVNNEFILAMQGLFNGKEFITSGFSQFNLLFLGIIVIAVIIDTADNLYHFIKHRAE